MVAYQEGKAAKVAEPATTSHISLPSQRGPMELTAMRRSTSSRPMNECSMPTPKSNPSRTKNPTQKMAMITYQMLFRCTMVVS